MNSPVDTSKILMQGIHVELTPALQRAIVNKFEAILRHEPGVTRLNVRLARDRHRGRGGPFHALAQVERKGADLVVETQGDDAYATLDRLSDRLFDLITREHDRARTERHRPSSVELATDLPET